MPTRSHHPSNTDPEYVFLRMPRHALRIVGIAAGVGFLLFLLAWWAGRDDGFYTAEQTASANAQAEPLPAPLPDGDGASGMEEPPAAAPQPAADPAEPVTEIETAPALAEEVPPTPVPETPEPAPAPAPADPVAAAPSAASVPIPIPGQSPSPAYPTSSVRRNETGTTLLRVQVGADGVPVQVDVVGRSGSRNLDRAAADAVRQWRFTPAQRDGQPVEGSVDVPITFNLER